MVIAEISSDNEMWNPFFSTDSAAAAIFQFHCHKERYRCSHGTYMKLKMLSLSPWINGITQLTAKFAYFLHKNSVRKSTGKKQQQQRHIQTHTHTHTQSRNDHYSITDFHNRINIEPYNNLSIYAFMCVCVLGFNVIAQYCWMSLLLSSSSWSA